MHTNKSSASSQFYKESRDYTILTSRLSTDADLVIFLRDILDDIKSLRCGTHMIWDLSVS